MYEVSRDIKIINNDLKAGICICKIDRSNFVNNPAPQRKMFLLQFFAVYQKINANSFSVMNIYVVKGLIYFYD